VIVLVCGRLRVFEIVSETTVKEFAGKIKLNHFKTGLRPFTILVFGYRGMEYCGYCRCRWSSSDFRMDIKD
jgi:hypothetical protein